MVRVKHKDSRSRIGIAVSQRLFASFQKRLVLDNR